MRELPSDRFVDAPRQPLAGLLDRDLSIGAAARASDRQNTAVSLALLDLEGRWSVREAIDDWRRQNFGCKIASCQEVSDGRPL